MVPKEMSADRPNGILLVVAYLLTVGAGLLFAGVVLLVSALPRVLDLAQGDSLFLGGAASIVLLALALLLAGGWLLRATRRLWQGRTNSRASAAVGSAALAIASLLSIPAFFFSYDQGTPLLLATVGGALLLTAASAVTFWYLARQHVKAYFG